LLTVAVLEEHEESEMDASGESAGEESSTPYQPMTPEELKAYLENMRPEDFGKFHF
jgi:hypothetical protein